MASTKRLDRPTEPGTMAVASVPRRATRGRASSSGAAGASSVSRASARTGATASPEAAIVSVRRAAAMLRTRADIAVILPRGPFAFARPRRLGP